MLFIKIYFTVLIMMPIVFGGGGILSQVDEKRESFWFKVSVTSGIVMVLMFLGIILYTIWFH
jgi:uncharacterized membrane protein